MSPTSRTTATASSCSAAGNASSSGFTSSMRPNPMSSFPDRVRQQYEYFGVTRDELTRAGAQGSRLRAERSSPEAFRRPHEEDVRPGTQQGQPVLRPGAGRRTLSAPGSCQRRAGAQQGQPPGPAVRRDGARSRAATPVNRGPRQAAAQRRLGQPRPASPMSPLERYYKIDQLLKDRKVVSFALFKEKLGMSRASVKRDIEYMRSRMHRADRVGPRAQRLLLHDTRPRCAALRAAGPVVQRRRDSRAARDGAAPRSIDAGILRDRLTPLRERLRELLGSSDHSVTRC